MPVHQLNRLACQCSFNMRHEFIEVEDVLCAGLAEIDTTFFTVLQIIKKTLAGETDKFTSDNFTGNDAFGVTYPIGNFSH
ncbi:Uncharacterised protein [Escherichia coli]|nr:Uncharacterised protein [Escherichia coli]VVZ93384.1 Uncharacterised protein [Escherichia coli]